MKKEDIARYEQFAKEKLGLEFSDIWLLITALTHRSYVNEHRRFEIEHNERLEFLGDAVLELVVSDFLYRTYDQPEGVMTAWRSALVRTEANSASGEALGYGPLVRLSHGEAHNTARAHAVIMADCFEAVIGAIYLDKGYDAAKDFIYTHVISKMDEILSTGSWRDPKSYFQELVQHISGDVPTYRTIKEEGPDHDKMFTIGAYVGKECYGTATDHSKQGAQGLAAREGIVRILKEHPELAPELPARRAANASPAKAERTAAAN